MKRIFKTACLITGLLFLQTGFAQINPELALAKTKEAVKLMDGGQIDESIKLLQEAIKLDPDGFDYPYELAYAYYLKEYYKEAAKILEKTKKHPKVSAVLFQLLGNSYDMMGKREKAFDAYDNGLKKFPESGSLYLEKGTMYLAEKDYSKAMGFYEKGIEVDPLFPSNYYRAASIYLGTTEEVWGLIYGEIFMNLERGSKRTAEMSQRLFDTYKSEINFPTDTSMTVSFCKQMNLSMDALSEPGKLKLPFCMIFEPTILMAVVDEKQIDLASLNRIRTRFVEQYYKMGHQKTYPNVLFDFQQEILKAGHLEAYNHWLLLKGDSDGFDTWRSENEEKWSGFIEWFQNNTIPINRSNRFYRSQY